MKTRIAVVIGLAATAVLSGCNDTTAPPSTAMPGGTSLQSLAGGAPKFWETGASVAWNELADQLIARRPTSASRVFSYLSLAQLRAAEAAAAGTQPHPPVSAAIGGASVAVLRVFFPLDIAEIEAALDGQEGAELWPGDKHEDFAAGEAIGRAVGARVNAYALGDGVNLTNPGVPPIGPGYWVWNGGPIVRGNLGARPFYLTSGDELRPPPPPAFGSAEYLTALAEVRQISDTRTAEQLAIAVYWNVNQSGTSNAAINGIARELIRSYRRSDADAARILFLMNSAAFDALIGCFDAKYTYWFIRPPQADPGITLPIGLPPHPSYPSAHSCASGAFNGVLAHEFPSEAGRLAQIAEEASLSRLYAGIHYRFDMEAGLALGRAAAAKALAADLATVAPLP
jgi:membrane-associated phospholipid phosphatase